MKSCIPYIYLTTRVFGQPEVCPGEEVDLIDVDNDKKSGGGGGGGGGFTAPPAVMPMPMAMPMPMPMPGAFNYPPPKGAVRHSFNKPCFVLYIKTFP